MRRRSRGRLRSLTSLRKPWVVLVALALTALAFGQEPPPDTGAAEAAEEEAADLPSPSMALQWARVPGPDASLRLRLLRAAGTGLLDRGLSGRTAPRAMPDGAALAASARAEAFGQRPPPEVAPLYWPEGFRHQQLSDFAQDFLNSRDLLQAEALNPYRIAQEQVRQFNDDPSQRANAALAAAAYWLANRDARPEDVAWTLFKRTRFVTRDAAFSMALPFAVKHLPSSLVEAPSQEGALYADLRSLSYASYDSAASLTEILLTASRRGMKAIAVADRNNTAGSEDALIVADRLRREGRLPADFTVIPAQTVRTTTGEILSLFTRSRVLDGTPIARAVDEIHQQGGVAIDLHPGQVGEGMLLRRVPFDGYIVQPGFFEMFRTLEVMGQPDLAGMMTLYAGDGLVAAGVGLLHSSIETPTTKTDDLRRAMRAHRATASSALLTPWITAATLKPIGPVEHFLNRYFIAEENLWLWIGKRIGSRYVRVRISWDDPVEDMMDLVDLPTQVRDLFRGGSALLRAPELQEVSVEFDSCRLVYQPSPSRYLIQTAFTW